MKLLREGVDAWNRFWFTSRSEGHLPVLGLFRACFGSVMLFSYFSRAFDVEFFYSQEGILPSAYRISAEMFRHRFSPLDSVNNVWVLHGLHSLLLLCLLSLALGFRSRASAVGSYVIHMMFLNRNSAVQFGVDTIGTFFLLYLCFTQC